MYDVTVCSIVLEFVNVKYPANGWQTSTRASAASTYAVVVEMRLVNEDQSFVLKKANGLTPVEAKLSVSLLRNSF